MNEAYFFKNIKNLSELKEKTKKALDNNERKQLYIVIKRQIMNYQEFIDFCDSFTFSQEIISKISHKLTMNKNYEYVCMSITAKEVDFEILVNSFGYSYARIIAIVKKGNENGLSIH